MKWLKTTAFSILLFTFFLSNSSCKKSKDNEIQIEFSKSTIAMSGANEVPANASTASGTMDVLYSRETRTLSYTVKWSGLPVPPSAMHIHGLAPSGFGAGVIQTIFSAANPAKYPVTGSYSGKMLVDGVAIKEADLLNGMYYMNIHTPSPYYPGGEIRGQITFN